MKNFLELDFTSFSNSSRSSNHIFELYILTFLKHRLILNLPFHVRVVSLAHIQLHVI